MSHIVDVISTVAVLMKFPLAVLIAILAVTYLTLGSGTLLVRVVRSTLPSPCDFPVVAALPLCDPAPSNLDPMSSIRCADFPSLVKIQNIVLDELIEDSKSGIALAVNIKHAELAVKDLVVVVRASNLTVRDVLARALNDFAADAKTAARGLQRLSARIHGTIDRCVCFVQSTTCDKLTSPTPSMSSFNTYALKSIETAKQRGGVGVSVAILRTFRGSMLGFSSQITRLVVEATTTMATLDRLEDHLSTIHQLNLHEAFATNAAMDNLLWELWTILGGNQDKLRDLRTRAQVLKDVERYRAVAVAYVAAASYTLQGIEAELQALRDRLTEYVAEPQEIPVEVHLASIELSLRRLREEKLQSPAGITAA